MAALQAHDLQIRNSALYNIGGNQPNVQGVVQVVISPQSTGQHGSSPTGRSPRQRSHQTDSDTYARILLPKRHGYPLWIPEPPSDIESYAREGLAIGDVGMVTFDGGFNYFFNVFLPRNHPHNQLAPPTLDHLTFNLQDVITKVYVHPPGHVIAGGSVVTYPGAPEDRHFQFSCSMGEAAILVLPDGGTRSDYRPRQLLRQYALRHGKNWYEWLNRKMTVPNGSLYLITGLDKTQNWCLASYSNPSVPAYLAFTATDDTTSNAQDFQHQVLQSSATMSAVGHQTRQYTSRQHGSVAARTRQLLQDGGLANQSVFIRGFKLAVNQAETVNTGPTEIPPTNQDIMPGPSTLSSLNFPYDEWHLYSGDGGIEVSDWHADPSTFYPEENVEITVESFPEIAPVQPRHPSDVISSYLFRVDCDAESALIHDDDWCAVLNEDDSSIPEDDELIRRVSEKFDIYREDGCLCLRQKDETHEDGQEDDDIGIFHPSGASPAAHSQGEHINVLESIDEMDLHSLATLPESYSAIDPEYSIISDPYSGSGYLGYQTAWPFPSTPSYYGSSHTSPWSSASSISSVSDADVLATYGANNQHQYNPRPHHHPDSSPSRLFTELTLGSNPNAFNADQTLPHVESQQPAYLPSPGLLHASLTMGPAFSEIPPSPRSSSNFLTLPEEHFSTRSDGLRHAFKQEHPDDAFQFPVSSPDFSPGAPFGASRTLGSPSKRHSPYHSRKTSPRERYRDVIPEAGLFIMPSNADESVGLGLEIAGAHTVHRGSSVDSQSDQETSQQEVSRLHVTSAQVANASMQRRVHRASFTCEVPGCGTTFTRRFNLKGHMRSHQDERPFVCRFPDCGKSFARKHDCTRHEKVHFSYRPHVCSGCGGQFDRMDGLHLHLRHEDGVPCRYDDAGSQGAGIPQPYLMTDHNNKTSLVL